ncbi:hypothetical protein AaE_003913 [Aphanomyces astaci]|uniref:Uncharacterized protein n=1 Tax=Aphanomyces astaci TaxID=112090 RepID=A0A6A5A637_APHAT|nr:hypothetical protein AaE_003913 [Aphanomyces astaci]
MMDPSVEMSPTTSKSKDRLGATSASPVLSGSEKYMKQLQSPSVRKLFSENQTVQNLHVIHNLKKNYRHRKLFEIWAFVVALVGLVLMLVENEVVMVAESPSTPLSEALKTAVSISTALLLVLIWVGPDSPVSAHRRGQRHTLSASQEPHHENPRQLVLPVI